MNGNPADGGTTVKRIHITTGPTPFSPEQLEDFAFLAESWLRENPHRMHLLVSRPEMLRLIETIRRR